MKPEPAFSGLCYMVDLFAVRSLHWAEPAATDFVALRCELLSRPILARLLRQGQAKSGPSRRAHELFVRCFEDQQRSGSGEVTAIDGRPASGVSASLRAAAALSPHRGFYHASSATSLCLWQQAKQPPAGADGGSRLAWTAPAATPGLGSSSPEPPPPAEPEEEKAEKADKDETSQCSPIQPSPSWKRLEKTVTAYVSRRNVSSSEYEQVCQRYEGHLNELKVLCDAVRQTNTSPRTASPERKPCSISFRELHDDKGFREFLELRDPLLTSRAARQRSCSPPKAPPPPAPRARSPRELRPEPRRSVSGRMASTRLPEENNSEAAEDKPVIPPLLSAGVLSDTPDSDLEHVRNLFATQVPEALVLGVYRVENPTLAGVYAAVRDAMGSDCELDLWHGTSSECVPNIVLNGFNRAYSGRTKLGHGCYFSASAAYSTKFCLGKGLSRSGRASVPGQRWPGSLRQHSGRCGVSCELLHLPGLSGHADIPVGVHRLIETAKMLLVAIVLSSQIGPFSDGLPFHQSQHLQTSRV
eukprot:s3070_g5.t1